MHIGDKLKKCSACGACKQGCPKKAIELEENSRGFVYPVINEKKCIDCGICVKICECYEGRKYTEFDKMQFFAVRHKDADKRCMSQSGGLFTAIAEVVLDRHGVCYGAAVSDDLVVCQTRITKKSELHKLQGSKYVQSIAGDSFKEVENDLDNGYQVLYSGTSCMIDGLKRYLTYKKADMSKLVTCDLICHGVPSPLMYRENLKRLEKQNKSNIVSVDFRNKRKFGWASHVETYVFENGKVIDEKFYTDLFYSHTALRECCYDCSYLDVNYKPADITMADFWGYKKASLPFENDNTGISLAIVRSVKGLDLLHAANLEICETTKESGLSNNLAKNSAKPPVWKENFWKDYEKNGFEYVLKKYTIYGGLPFKVKRKFLKKIGRW